MAGRAVSVEKIGEDDGVRQPVRHAVLTAERMGHAVDIADVGAGEGHARAVCGAEHIRPRLHVAAVFVGGIQTADDARRGLFGHGAGQLGR